MFGSAWLPAALICSVGVALAADSHVSVLSSVAEFDAFRSKQAGFAVLVYAPWCGHSRALLPEFEKAAASGTTAFAKVDGTEAEALATKLDVKGYPTLLFVHRGDGFPLEYDGQRTEASISKWVKSMLSPSVQQLPSVGMVKAFTKGKPVALVLFVADASAPEAEAMYGVAASANLPCATSTASPAELGLSALTAPSFVAFTSHAEPAVMDSSTALTHASMLRFGKMHALPALVTYTSQLEEALFSAEVGLHLLYFHSADLDSATTASLQAAGEQLRGDAIVATIAVGSHGEVAAFFDVGASSQLPTPSLMGFSLANGTKFAFKGTMDAASVVSFARDASAGLIAPHLRSQPEPSSSGPLVELVGSTFARVAHDPTKHVLVQFYSPGCGHCEKLKPVYQSVAAKLADLEDIIVAQMDATANDVLGFEPEGFPTIVLYPKENKGGVEYDGSRDAHDLIQFVKDARAGRNHIGGLSESSIEPPDEDDGYRVEL
uniref:Thioredoxin domain-containing protein n=1 Tax=Haptolina brevifila TaxID=156173 RepID=A0A7S2ID30_9EUKA|mmetsp:Transcript_64513/g.127437  ORF Transcript_64513/g.127437 Transcript_64513/m.127437 type:complete len:491 (+) Transcript_64513:126-1598(+)